MKTLYEKYLLSSDQINETDEYLSDMLETAFDFIDTLDFDDLSDEQVELLENFLDMCGSEEEISEVRKERVVRGGKRTRKVKCKSGYKAVGGRCVRMSSSERRTRSKAAKRGARKKKGQKKSIERKRKRSIRKRT